MKKYVLIIHSLFLLFFVVVQSTAQTRTTSRLWGENGELWDSRGRLPDFSYAGYGGGYAEAPNFSNIIDVTTRGVVPNDNRSYIDQINTIIKNAPDNSIVYFPAGKYIIDKQIIIDRSNIGLRGAGDQRGETEFYLPLPSKDVHDGDRGKMFVQFQGKQSRVITEISEEALRTDRVIVVKDASKLSRGDMIEIRSSGGNPTNGELWHEFFHNQMPDWPEPHAKWASGDNAAMTYTIEKIEGNLITLREPLRLKVKPSWNMLVRKRDQSLEKVGIESIRFAFEEAQKKPHLKEDGYNAVGFNYCQNVWVKDLTIIHCDQGMILRDVAYGDVSKIEYRGREGHNAINMAYSSSLHVSDILFNNDSSFLHSISFIHKSNGNVVRNIKGINNSSKNNIISKDFHRNAPFSNLWTDVRTENSHRSSGDSKSGPRAGAHNVYWGLHGKSTGLYSGNPENWKQRWGEYRNTIVSEMDLNAGRSQQLLTEDREWYEHLPNLKEKDLYKLQLDYRSTHQPELVFNSGKFGNRENWNERDLSRWKVQGEAGSKRYTLVVEELPPVSVDKLSEYSVIDIPQRSKYEVEAKMKIISDRANRPESDMALVFAFENDNNYLFGRISTDENKSGIFRVTNGVVSKLKSSGFKLGTNNYMVLKVMVDGSDIEFLANDRSVASVSNVQNLSFGRVGFGSAKNGLSLEVFKNIVDQTFVGPNGYTFSVIEGGTVSETNTVDIAFGNDGQYTYLFNQSSDVGCTIATFGNDPIAGVKKACFIRNSADYTPPEGYTVSVNEKETVPVNERLDIAFGVNGKFVYLLDQSSDVTCDITTFGSDPEKGYKKKCFIRKVVITSTEEDLTSTDEISVFPNPSENGVFHLSKETNWELLDSEGRVLQTGTSKEINLVDGAPGAYFLRVEGQVVKLVYE